jgi:hypothetical protein
MPRYLTTAFLMLIVAAPSAIFAWRALDMPEFGYLHDDGIFYVSAKSLASGNGYRIESLPEDAAQSKFPPLYPAFLSLVWRLNPKFPSNLSLATVASWLALLACLWLARLLYKGSGFTPTKLWISMALLGLNPYMILFGTRLFSEIPFTALVLATFLVARRPGNRAILYAGSFAAAAFLTRTAGIAVVASVLTLLLLRRDYLRAKLFALVTLPVILAWGFWSGTHHATGDLTLTYYTNYLGFQFANVGWDNILVVLWKNADQILYSIGSLIIPKVVENTLVKMLTDVVAVAMIMGVVRMARKGTLVDYAVFSIFSTAILLVWHYPATERFVLPMFPLLAAGLVTEAEHLWAMLRLAMHNQKRDQRIAGYLFGAVVAAVFLAALALQVYVSFFYLKDSADSKRIALAARRADYQWIAANLPSNAAVLSYDDPLLYLYTGHRGNYLPMMPRWWYAEDKHSTVDAYRNLEEYCRARGLAYIYFSQEDLSREAGEEERLAVEKILQTNAALTPVYSSTSGTVYRVLPWPR